MNRKLVYIKSTIYVFLITFMMFTTSCVSQEVALHRNEVHSTVSSDNRTVGEETAASETTAEDSCLEVDITMEGGSGKAHIISPVSIEKKDGRMTATFIWTSENYDYMLVDGIKYDNENPGGRSTFTIPVDTLDEPLEVTGDTVAMSTPHEIEYTIYWGEPDEGSSLYSEETVNEPGDASGEDTTVDTGKRSPEQLGTLIKTGEMELKHATQYAVSYYGDYALISIAGSGDYLLVPEGSETPEGIPDDITLIGQPPKRTYLVSSAAMDLVCKCGGLDNILFSGTRADDWYVEEAAAAMKEGRILYAGKYRAPDYELILSGGCDLAIENTMIYHNPEVKEKLEELGIPVLVETSSYESSPLGRLEWIKLYGLLYGKEKEAGEYYNKQIELMEPVIHKESTGKSVAFFHITTNGMVTVRKNGDYISTMIGMAGGEYVGTMEDKSAKDGGSAGTDGSTVKKDDTGGSSNALSTMNIQMEDFYASALDADILIYNSTIEGEIHSVDELINKSGLFRDFKAVKEGQVYCTEPALFQEITGMGDFIMDLNAVFTGEKRDMIYLTKLE